MKGMAANGKMPSTTMTVAAVDGLLSKLPPMPSMMMVQTIAPA